MASKIYFIRHGITDGNKKGWFYGEADIHLAEEGKAQLKAQVEKGFYPQINDDTDVYTTGMIRTEETLEIIYGKVRHQVIENLRELKFGIYECKTWDELKDNEEFVAWANDTVGDAPLSGGETNKEFTARISKGLAELRGYHSLKELSHRHSGKDAVSVVVCHGGVISSMMQEMFPGEKKTIWDWIPEPGLGYCVEFIGGKPMEYERIYGTKKMGFGMMRLPMKGDKVDMEQSRKMVDIFMEKGFNYFDTAYSYIGGQSEAAVKTLIVDRYPRESFKLATKLPVWEAETEEEFRKLFDTSLERTGAGYFDFYMLHSLSAEKMEKLEKFHAWEYINELKLTGKVKNIGFSFHDSPQMLEDLLQKHPEMDFVQLQINYIDWENEGVQARKCYEVARKYNKPIIIMEPVKGGSLATIPSQVEDILKEADPELSAAGWAMKYACQLPGIITVLSGSSSLAQMEDNLATMEKITPFTEDETAALNKAIDTLNNIPRIECTACGYCKKGCPSNLNIPDIFDAMNTSLVFGNFAGAKGNYMQWVTDGVNFASNCVKCGACEEICPQKLNIIKLMEEAVEMFGK